MRTSLNLSLFLVALFIFEDKSISLTNYQIKNICKKAKNKSNCKKSLKEKNLNLEKGNIIEIPVIPYKRKLKFKFQILIQKD